MDKPTRKIELRLGTRASLLALQQAHWVKKRVEDLNPEVTVTLVHIKTTGDKLDFPLFKVGGRDYSPRRLRKPWPERKWIWRCTAPRICRRSFRKVWT